MSAQQSGYPPYIHQLPLDRSHLALEDSSSLTELLSDQPAIPLLPPDLDDFSGRQSEIQQAIALWHQLPSESGQARVLAIVGQAGVGKSVFAIHLAHQLKPLTTAQIYLNLRHEQPISLTAIVQQIQSVAASSDRQILILLDNLDDPTQISAWLKQATNCTFLITSRQPLTATTLELDNLSELDAIALLQAIAKSKLRDADSETMRFMIHCCDGSPLALRLIAGWLQTQPDVSFTDCVTQLQAERQRCELSHLSYPAIRASFNLSYQTLDAQSSYLLRLLGLLPQPSVTLKTAAALSELSIQAVQESLAHLLKRHLLETIAQRYYLSEQLRLLVKSQLAIAESTMNRQSARLRLSQSYRDVIKVMSLGLIANQRQQLAQLYSRGRVNFEQRLFFNAQRWFTIERANLLSAVDWAFQAEEWKIGLEIVNHLTLFLSRRGEWAEAETRLLQAIAVVDQAVDRLQMAQLFNNLGNLYLQQGQWEQANQPYQRCLELLQTLEEPIRESQTLANLGIIHLEQGDRDTAVALWAAALMSLPLGSVHDRNLLRWMQSTNQALLEIVLLQLDDRQRLNHFLGAIGRLFKRNYQWMLKS